MNSKMMVNQKHSVDEKTHNSQASVDYCSSQKRRKLSNDEDENVISTGIFCGDLKKEPKDVIEISSDEDDEEDIELIDLNLGGSCHSSPKRDDSCHSTPTRDDCTSDMYRLSGEIIQTLPACTSDMYHLSGEITQTLPALPMAPKIERNVQDGGNIADTEIEGRHLSSSDLTDQASNVSYVEMDPLLEASNTRMTSIQSTDNSCLKGSSCVTQLQCIIKKDSFVVVKTEDNSDVNITATGVKYQLKTIIDQELASNANKIPQTEDCEKVAAFTEKGETFTEKGEKIKKDKNSISTNKQLSFLAGKVSNDNDETSHKKDCEKEAAFTRKGEQIKKDNSNVNITATGVKSQLKTIIEQELASNANKTSQTDTCEKVSAFTRKGEKIKRDKNSISSNKQLSFRAGKVSNDNDETSHRKDCEKEAAFTRRGEQIKKDKQRISSNKQLSFGAGKVSSDKDEDSQIPNIPVFPRSRNMRRCRMDKIEDNITFPKHNESLAFTRKGEQIKKDKHRISSNKQLSSFGAGKVSSYMDEASLIPSVPVFPRSRNMRRSRIDKMEDEVTFPKHIESLAFTKKGEQIMKDKHRISSNKQLSSFGAGKVSSDKDEASLIPSVPVFPRSRNMRRSRIDKMEDEVTFPKHIESLAFTKKGEQIKKDKHRISSNKQLSSFGAGKVSSDKDEASPIRSVPVFPRSRNMRRSRIDKMEDEVTFPKHIESLAFTKKGEQIKKDKHRISSNKQLSSFGAGKVSSDKDEASPIPSVPVFPRSRNMRRSRIDKMEDESGASQRSRERSTSPEGVELEARSISVGTFTGYPTKPVTVCRDEIKFRLKDEDDIYATFDVEAKELKYCFTCFNTSNISYIFFLVHPSCSYKIKKCVRNDRAEKVSNAFILRDNKGPSFSIITLVIEKIKQEMILQLEKYMDLYYKSWGKQSADMFYLGITHSEAAMIRALNKSEISQNTFRSSITDDVRTFLQLSRSKPLSKNSCEVNHRNKQGWCKLTASDRTRRKNSTDVSVNDSSEFDTSLGKTQEGVHTSGKISTLSNLNADTQNEEIGTSTVVVKQEQSSFDLSLENSVNPCSIFEQRLSPNENRVSLENPVFTSIKQEPRSSDITLETNVNPSAIAREEKGIESSFSLKEEAGVIDPISSSQLICEQSVSLEVQDVKANQESTLIPVFPVTPRKEHRSRRDQMENKSGACQRSRERSSSPAGVELEARSVSVGTFTGHPTEPVTVCRDGVKLVVQGADKRFPVEFKAVEIQQCYAHFSISDFNYLFFILSPQGRARIKRSFPNIAEEKRENTFINNDLGPSYSIITIVMEDIEQDQIAKFEKLMELYKGHQKSESFFMKITHPEAAMIRALDKSARANSTLNSNIANDIKVFLQLTQSKSH